MLFAAIIASTCSAAIPAALTLVNLREYQEPPPAGATPLPAVTVVVPARNEAAGIRACLESVLRSAGVELRAAVVDDASTDGTAEIVRAMASTDARVVLLQANALPDGWNGKQHACWQGAQAAATPIVCFLDADVRLQTDALARMAALLVFGDGRPGAGAPIALVSGFPLEETGTALEWLLLPLIHFVLLGLLPMWLLRQTTNPGLAAGCGQFLMVERAAYMQAGGHAAIRKTMHDGILLPRLLRQHGFSTRLADLTTLASCRMYRSSVATWNGLSKNATEGLGSPASIVPMTLLLGLGQVLPLPLLTVVAARLILHRHEASSMSRKDTAALSLAITAVALSYLPRVVQASRFRHKKRSVALHPIGVATLLVLQWQALGRKLLGLPATWKDRSYIAP